jgi:anti-sigma B factor antagonist
MTSFLPSGPCAGEGRGPVSTDHAPELTVRDQWDDDVATVEVSGEIDLSTVGAFSAHLGDVAGQNPKRLVIDLSGVAFVDSSGLHAFVRVRRILPESCPIVLRSPRRQVRQVFDVTGLAPVFAFE